MENMNKSSWESVNSQWDNLNDDVVDNRAELSRIEARQAQIQRENQEILAQQFQGDPNDFEMRGIFEERKEYELRRLSDEDYNLEIRKMSL